MSVPDVSGKAIANLEIESLRHVAPTFHGDTVYGETTVLDKTESRSKDDRGVVYVETIGYKQDGTVVCIFRRKVMVPKRSYGEARGGEQPGRPSRSRAADRRRAPAPGQDGSSAPATEGLQQPRRAGQPLEVCRVGEGDGVRVVPGDRRGPRVQQRAGQVHDVVDDAGTGDPHPAHLGAGPHRQAGLLAHLALDGRGHRLPGLDPTAGHRPQPAAGLVAPADQQQPAAGVEHHRTDAGDHRQGVVGGGRHDPHGTHAPAGPSA
jgi:hypothetical protein